MKIRAGFVSNSSSSSFIVASKHYNVSEAKRISEFEEVYEDGTGWNEDFANELKGALTLVNTSHSCLSHMIVLKNIQILLRHTHSLVLRF